MIDEQIGNLRASEDYNSHSLKSESGSDLEVSGNGNEFSRPKHQRFVLK